MQDMQLGWDAFPPVLESANHDDIFDDLGKCRLMSVTVDAVDRLTTIALRDQGGEAWLFSFEGADLFCDTSRTLADQVDGDLGIWHLDASETFTRAGRQVRLFQLEGNVNLSIFASSVKVARGPATTTELPGTPVAGDA